MADLTGTHDPSSERVSVERACDDDLIHPFGELTGLEEDDIRETAYEIFFTACRSSPGFGARSGGAWYSENVDGTGPGSGEKAPGGGGLMSPGSKIKRALGLKMLKRSPSRPMSQNPGSANPVRPRRPLTSAEIMRHQMRVTEHSDNRLRKMLTRTHVAGQADRRVETIILPLELIRHLKASEFSDSIEYHLWQKRQLRILEAGLLLFPSVPLEKTNIFATRLREIIRSGNSKPIDIGKTSDTMRILCNSVVSLAWRSDSERSPEGCHWVDGYPLNVHVYITLLRSIFASKDEGLVLDEVDELLELMKRTWPMLGIAKPIHNICFTWVFFQRYVEISCVEQDLLAASHVMLREVASDAKSPKREGIYMKMLSSLLSSMLGWTEKRLLSYHDYFTRETAGCIENLLPLAITASKILVDNATIAEIVRKRKESTMVGDSYGDHYIRSSINNAFKRIIEAENFNNLATKAEASEILFQLAKQTANLALKERETFSPLLKKWNPVAAGLAAATLHSCYGSLLKKYLSRMMALSSESIEVLQEAGKLEKILLQMVSDDTSECEDRGAEVAIEIVPYEIDSIISSLSGQWIEERLRKMRECLRKAKETEVWNPKSKTEPYAPSAVELTRLAQQTVEDFLNIPIGIAKDVVDDLVDCFRNVFQDYTKLVSSCGSKQSYIPTLPPLTRCNRGSAFSKLLKRVRCHADDEDAHLPLSSDSQHDHPRPSTSRKTQRLYIRLNTLHYLLSHLHALDKTLSLSSKFTHRRHRCHRSSHFDFSCASIHAACKHVSEVAAYRLIFLDSSPVFYDGLYVGDVPNARIRPALRILKQNLTLLCSVVVDQAQPLAIVEVMKASFEVFLMVLLAGGSTRVFQRADYVMVEEDLESMKKVFWTCGEGIVNEEMVSEEAETVEGVIDLMSQCTGQLIEDFSILTCQSSGMGIMRSYQKLPMPPTTGRWNQSDPNTILRVLCHRSDRTANKFLKKTFQMARRK